MADVIIRPIDLAKDAQGLADMWNASDLQWPGTFCRGVPFTAAMVREWEAEERMLAVLVAEVDGQIAGFCTFMHSHDSHDDEGYLVVLNVHPKYQQRSIGRKLIQATVACSVKERFQRQTLETWSANFKAVPTYKKTGYFWTPDTFVQMQNFIPGALQMPLAKGFFERHDWYDCYVRQIEQTPDDQRWEGLKVFRQRWQADGEALTIWIDREARAPVAVENDQLQIAAIADQIEPLAGSKVKLRWRVINKGEKPIQVFLHALGDKGLSIDHRDAYTVPAGETVIREAEVKVADDGSGRKDDGRAPAVRSIIRLNDQEVELFSGLRVRKPWNLDTSPGEITVRPGVSQVIKLQLHSEREEETNFALYLTPPEGLQLDWRTKSGTLPAKGHIALPLTVTASEEKVYTLPIRVESQGLKPLTQKITLFSLGDGGLLAQRQGNSVRLETDDLRVKVEAQEGTISFHHRSSNLKLGAVKPRLGPPYRPSVFGKKEFELSLQERAGRAIIDLVCEPQHYEGLYLHQRFALSPTGVGTLEYYLENRGHQAQAARLQLSVTTSATDKEQFIVPLPTGIVQSPSSAYPTAWDDVPRDAKEYAEPWLAWERRGGVMGVAWDEALEQIGKGWTLDMNTAELTVEPGERSRRARFELYAGTGTWQAVQRSAQQWMGQVPRTSTSVRPTAVARVEPAVMATLDDATEGRVIVDSTMRAAADGEVSLLGEDGLSLAETIKVKGLQRGTPLEQQVVLPAPTRPGVGRGEAVLSLPLWETRRTFQVVRLGDGEPVSVAETDRKGRSVWLVDNGLCQFAVAPDFGPSVISWTRSGEEQLWSTFPEAQGFSWLYPYFGGIHALLAPAGSWGGVGYLHREKATAESVVCVDKQGIVWQGVRAAVEPQKRELRDLVVELDYLTVGHSPILKVSYRLRNRRASERAVVAGINCAFALGAGPTSLVALAEGVRRGPSPRDASLGDLRWAALTNAASGQTALLVGRQDDVTIWDAGQAGMVLGADDTVRLLGEQVLERTYYLVLADSPQEAKRFRVLGEYEG